MILAHYWLRVDGKRDPVYHDGLSWDESGTEKGETGGVMDDTSKLPVAADTAPRRVSTLAELAQIP